MERPSFAVRRHRGVVVAVAVLLAAAAFAVTPPAEVAAQDERACEAYPVDRLRTGQSVHGLTVERGDRPERFRGEIIGVLDDGIGLDVDMIIAELRSDALDRAGGIWFGISGSPVYSRDGRLIGSVSYGLSAGPTRIAGITPAETMLDLLAIGESPAALARAADARVPLDGAARDAVVATGEATAAQAAEGMRQLPVPLGISGLSSRRMTQIADAATAHGYVPFTTASVAPGDAADVASIRPGGNFAAALSYGDLTMAGLGTTTAVCDGVALAFGHPLLFAGPTTFSAHGAEALYLQPDPLFGPFKVGNIGGPVGTVDQDRLAGLRGRLGPPPAAVPIESSVTADGVSRDGASFANRSDAVADVAGFHLLANIDATYDRFAAGRSVVSWTVTGRTSDGTPWSLERANRYASQFDIGFESIFEVLGQLATIQTNPFTAVEFERVELTADVAPDYRASQITGLEVAVDDGPFVPAADIPLLEVAPGAELRLRVTLSPYRAEGEEEVHELALTVPTELEFAEGQVAVTGGLEAGGGGEECLFDPELCESGGDETSSFDGLLEQLATGPRNDDLVARLDLFGEFPEPIGEQTTARASQVVTGARGVGVVVGGFPEG